MTHGHVEPLRVRIDAARARDEKRPRMANLEDRRPGLDLTSRALMRDGRPWLPVSGELHYSRVPRERWTQRLRLMRSGGVSVVSTYVPWIHHEPIRGSARFDGRLDVGAFVDAVRAEELEVVLRIGPWIHAEVRNGGFPDWVQHAPVRHRTDDPGYLALVREWFAQVARALDGRATPDTLLAIQLDNELYDQPEHLVTLKRLAREAGMSAPLWTATAWGGADLPDPEVLPLWGGYGDGFWVDAGDGWNPTFRAHYFFSDTWDDPGIGADVRGDEATGRSDLSAWFPPATCELAGGMATAYHRRPRPEALDIAAIAHAKLGSGSAWQGYYMYAGGTNPGPELAESHATGYPNDMTRWGYDFHAPIGEAGRAAPSHAALRGQHAFIDAFGSLIAAQPAHLPDILPSGVEDSSTLRWAVRGTATPSFLFIGWHQPHVPLDPYPAARFRVETPAGPLLIPSAPVRIPPGTLARWPVGLEVGGVRIAWATASALTVLPGAVPTLVLLEDPGIPVELAHGDAVHRIDPSGSSLRLTADDGSVADVLVLASSHAPRAWVVETTARRRLLLTDDELTWDAAGRVSVRAAGDEPAVKEYASGAWRAPAWEHVGGTSAAASLSAQVVRGPAVPPGAYEAFDGRQSAPEDAVLDAYAAVYRVQVPAWCDEDAVLRVAWAGDVAQLRVDGVTMTDRFWDGSDLVVNLSDVGAAPGGIVDVRVLPLRSDTRVHLPRDAAARLAAAGDALCAIDAVLVDQRSLWREVSA